MGRKFYCIWSGMLMLALEVPLPITAAAAWPRDPLVNLPICTAAGDQGAPKIIADGVGGTIVTWQDSRGIYTQHVLANGMVDPAWPADGRALCTAQGGQNSPALCAAGASGAIVSWMDNRSGHADIYAQHVLASGVVDSAWPADGAALCTAADDQFNPAVVPDGGGGAIAVWFDYRSGPSHIYAQHVLANGAVDPAWPTDGLALCTSPGGQAGHAIIEDGNGGAIVTWHDYRSGSADIYAQHVLASGAADASWPAEGRALCTSSNNQWYPKLVSDGAGGAIVTWYDFRSSIISPDIYAQHVLASGEVDPAWPTDGRALCAADGAQEQPSIVADGSGGAIAVWQDTRNGAYDIYAQHVLAIGAVDPNWPADGRALCTAADRQESPAIAVDGAGGAIATWEDQRAGYPNHDIYAEHVLASGALDPNWPGDGRALCTAANSQEFPALVANGSGGAVAVWQDYRSGYDYDIYAQRVDSTGYLGSEVLGVGVWNPTHLLITLAPPSPAIGDQVAVILTLPTNIPAHLDVFDVAGRRVYSRQFRDLGRGAHRVNLASPRLLLPGIYYATLSQGQARAFTRIAILQ